MFKQRLKPHVAFDSSMQRLHLSIKFFQTEENEYITDLQDEELCWKLLKYEDEEDKENQS